MKKIIVSTVLVSTLLWNNVTFANNEASTKIQNIETKIDTLVAKWNFSYDEIYEKLFTLLSKNKTDVNNEYVTLLKDLSLKINRETTFMPYGWYESTVKWTSFVEASNQTKLNVWEKIKDLTSKSYTFVPTVQRMTDRTYWVQVWFYNAMFYVWDKEVLVFDTLAWWFGAKMIEEIRKVTDKPITTLVYSHQHEDHIGDVQYFIDEAKKDGYDLKIISSDRTYDIMKENSSLPLATEVLNYTWDSFQFENETIKLQGFQTPAHEEDSAMWILENEKVMHIPDYVNPDQMAYLWFGWSQTYRNYRENLEEMLTEDFEFFSGWHGNVWGKADVQFMFDYTTDLENAIQEAQANINTFDYFIPSYNNHQASALRWENEIIDFVMKKLRPKYGNFYGFEASVPHQIRLVMLSKM